MSLFKVDQNFTTILNPDAVKICEHLRKVGPDELLYIILAYDNTDGPFRMKPPDERINLAKKKVFGTLDVSPETIKVRKAIEEYQELIFDVRRQTVDNYKKRIIKLQRESLFEDVTHGKLKDIDAAIRFLQGRIEELESELSYEEKTELKVKGDKKLSFIEKWQLNKKRKREQDLSS